MKKLIAISIIMSEYNTDEKILRESIQSILDQTYEDFEFIIINDGTRSNLTQLAKELDDTRIRIIKNPRNMGFVYSLNKGIKEARGEYIVRMDTDDIALPTRIQTQYDFITAHPEYSVVGTKAIEFSSTEEYGVLGKGGEKDRKSIMHGDSIIHPSAIIRKSSIEKAGYYKNYKRAEDLALWCEMLRQGNRLYVIDEVLLKYRVNPEDYRKRKIKNRLGEIKARLYFYPKMGATPFDYLYILKSIVAGILPSELVRAFRKRFVLKKEPLVKRGGKS